MGGWRVFDTMTVTRPKCVILALFALAIPMAAREIVAQASPGGRLDVVGYRQHVTKDLGDWSGVTARLVARQSARDTWYGDALYQRAFHDEGVYAGIGERHAMSDRWSSYVSVGGGTGEFVLPDLRADAQLAYAWGASRRLVTTMGATFVDAKRGYSDVSGLASLTAYLSSVAVLEVGERVTRSAPGGVRSGRTSGALTMGREGATYVVLRGSAGTEGYQLIGPSTAIRRFQSQEGTVSWRQWLGKRGGVLVQGDRYSNDLYSRTGVSLGVFGEW